MSYKDNKYFKKYCNKHKDVKMSIRNLETFCKEENCKMEIYGSLVRPDFYYGQSDGDVIIVCNNVEELSSRFSTYIYSHSKMIYKKKKIIYTVDNNIKNSCSGRILHTVSINGYNFDISIICAKEYRGNSDSCIPKHNFMALFLMSIVKFFYYKMNIMSKDLYYYLKKKLMPSVYEIVRKESYQNKNV